MVKQKRLVIERVMDWDTVDAVTDILIRCPGGPTFGIQRGEDGLAHLFLSRRTYGYLNNQLRELRRNGEI